MTDYRIDPKFFEHLSGLVLEIHEAMVGQLALSGPEHAGKADKVPWSGHWWPFNEASSPNMYDVDGPLDKYDAYVKKGGSQANAVGWEKANHFRAAGSTASDANWAGHCNGVAAASIMEAEPTKPKTRNGIAFGIGDQKGLMTEYHWFDALVLGAKIGDDAAMFHKLVIDWIGKGRLAVAMDTSLGSLVYNHAAGAYQMAYAKDAADPALHHVTATIFFAGYAAPDAVGTEGWPSHFGKQ